MADFGQRTHLQSRRRRGRSVTPCWITPKYPIISGPWTVPVSPGPSQSSPPVRLVLHISRLVYTARARTPKGIPRVELAYAEHLGTIEPRKNHKRILELWLELHCKLGPSMPRLLVVGERGWKSRDVIDLLESAASQGVVQEYGRLSDAAVAGLLKGARALLHPSLTEALRDSPRRSPNVGHPRPLPQHPRLPRGRGRHPGLSRSDRQFGVARRRAGLCPAPVCEA